MWTTSLFHSPEGLFAHGVCGTADLSCTLIKSCWLLSIFTFLRRSREKQCGHKSIELHFPETLIFLVHMMLIREDLWGRALFATGHAKALKRKRFSAVSCLKNDTNKLPLHLYWLQK